MSNYDYTERQQHNEAVANAAWEEWLAKKSPREIAKMRALGLVAIDEKTGKPKNRENGYKPEEDVCRDGDAAEIFDNTKVTAVWEDIAEKVDKLPDLLRERFGVTSQQAEAIAAWYVDQLRSEVQRETGLQLARIIGFYVQPGNVSVRTHALAHAARLAGLSGFTSLRHSARLLKVSVEAIRKVAWTWVDLLALPPLEGSKSQEARAAYSADKKTNHWRHQKCNKKNLQ